MAEKKKQDTSPFFQSGWCGKLPKIVAISLCFHLLILLGVIGLNKLNFEREPEQVKIFPIQRIELCKYIWR